MSDLPLPATFRLDGRVAVVTGGGGGLGRAFCLALAEAGAFVVVADRDRPGATTTVTEIESAGGRAAVEVVDIADVASVEDLARRIADAHRALHVLVNNAGISTPSRRIHETPVETWDRVIAVNLRGPFLVTRALLPQMFDVPGAAIVNIASTVGLRALDPAIVAQAGYAASKAGVVALTMQTAVEYADRGVRANAIAPGWHHGTNLGRDVGNLGSPEATERLNALVQRRTPMGRTGAPAELEGLLLYLASDASSFLTGQVIAHDGGWTAW